MQWSIFYSPEILFNAILSGIIHLITLLSGIIHLITLLSGIIHLITLLSGIIHLITLLSGIIHLITLLSGIIHLITLDFSQFNVSWLSFFKLWICNILASIFFGTKLKRFSRINSKFKILTFWSVKHHSWDQVRFSIKVGYDWFSREVYRVTHKGWDCKDDPN